MAIVSFIDSTLEAFFYEDILPPKGCAWTQFSRVLLRKLEMLHAAAQLQDLRAPPSNHLEALLGDLSGKHSIRVNDQWRLVFSWTSEGPAEVALLDYH